jgi:hypothetical protein
MGLFIAKNYIMKTDTLEEVKAQLDEALKTLEWLGKQGVCWREADAVDEWWKIGDGTEWFYGDAKKLRSTVETHKLLLLDLFG